MEPEFFNDAELKSMRAALYLMLKEMETLHAATHDFSKRRLRLRLLKLNADIDVIIRSLPSSV